MAPARLIPRLHDAEAELFFGDMVRQDVIWGWASSSDISSTVKDVQELLKEINLYADDINGSVPSTVQAIKAFNRKIGLPEHSPRNWKNVEGLTDVVYNSYYNPEPELENGYLFTDGEVLEKLLWKMI